MMRTHLNSALIGASLAGKNPGNYFDGLRTYQLLTPNNILAFLCQSLTKGEAKGHVHPRFALIANLRGQGRIQVENRTLILRKNQCLLVFPHQFHRLSTSDVPLHWVIVTFELEQPELLADLRHAILRIEGRLTRRLAELIACYVDRRHPHERANRVALTLSLLLHELREQAQAQAGRKRPSVLLSKNILRRRSQLVERLTQRLCHQPDRYRTLSSLARAEGLSVSYVRRIGRGCLTMPLGRYLRITRMRLAAARLMSTTLSVKEIAAAFGFASASSFNHLFKRTYRVTPRQYRERTQSGTK